MAAGRSLAVLLLLCALTGCPGGGSDGPSDAGPSPSDAGDSGTPSGEGPVLPSIELGETSAGASFSRDLGASGGAAPLTYSALGLPASLTLDPTTGRITGAVATAGSFAVDVSVSDGAGRVDRRRYSLVVLEAPRFVTTLLPGAIAGVPYEAALELTGGKQPLVLSAVELPPGVTLDPDSRAVRATFSSAGALSLLLRVTDAYGAAASASFSISIAPPLTLATTVLPDAYLNGVTTTTLRASGGSPPYAWSRVAGTLPPGMTLSAEGVYSGNPTAAGAFTFTAQVTDSCGDTASRELTANAYAPLTLAPSTPADAYVSEPYSTSFSSTGGKAPYTFSISAGALPPGLSLLSGGVLSGTPTASGAASFSVTVRDANARTSTRPLSVSVYALPTLFPTLPEARAGEFYSHTLAVSGGKPNHTFTLTSGAPPSGITLSSNGVLSGTTTSSGTSFGVRVTDANGRAEARMLSLSVYAPPRITTLALPEGVRNVPYHAQLGYSGGRGSLSWGHSGTLPPGLAFGSDGSVFGTPITTGTWSFTVTLQDSVGGMDSRVFPLTIRAGSSDGGSDGGTGPDGGTPSDGGSWPDAGPWDGGPAPDGGTWPDAGPWPDGGSWPDGGTEPDAGPWDGGPAPDGGTWPDGGTEPDGGVSFVVAHWNIEWFGSDTQGPPNSTPAGGPLDATQFANVRDLLLATSANLWGLVEITDGADFAALKVQLPGYSGFLSDDPVVQLGSAYYGPNEQKLGVLYDSRLTFQSAELILTSVEGDFAFRPPMRVNFLTSINGVSTPLTVIVVHMKAFADQASYERRQRASLALKNYLDARPSEHVLVLGDWNDDVDVSITRDAGQPLPSPYANFLQDADDYAFVTRLLSAQGASSTTDFTEMIDHTLATDEVMARYIPSSAQVLNPSWIPDYAGTTSDHYPVLSRYDFGSPPMPPMLNLTGPTGGTYLGYSPLTITWEASPGLGIVMLTYSLDMGTTWEFLTYIPDPSVGSYTWTVPNVDSTSVLLRITKLDTLWPDDISDAPLTFVSVPPPPQVFINEYLPNEPSGPLPDGGTGALVDFEFIELVNGGAAPVDLSGWTLSDGISERHVFSPGTVLQPGKAWVVYGGPSAFPAGRPNTEAASTGRLALNNTGNESITLRDTNGVIVSDAFYSSTVDNVSYNRELDGWSDVGFTLHTNISTFFSSAGHRADGAPF